jgi:hypothetical protein
MKRLISSSLTLVLVVAAMVVWLSDSLIRSHAASPATSALPTGPFTTLPPGSALPGDAECAARVQRSAWEPRPENATANQTNVYAQGYRLHGSYLAQYGAGYEDRVTGNFTGTTDEIFQWAACKWGFALDTVRAQAVQESSWRQSQLGDCLGGRTVMETGGCQSVGILQIRGAGIPPIHPGTWPYALESTAFNVDYTLAVRRLCFDGKETWLGNGYQAGDLWGCIGRWFSGAWHDSAAENYIKLVQQHMTNQEWNSYGAGPAPIFSAGGTNPSPAPPPTLTSKSTWRIDAGGSANYTDSKGNVWQADTGFTGGNSVDRGNIPIANAADPKIYQTEHYGMTSASYSVPNGSYTVNLYFAETYLTGAGQRIFNVAINGKPVLSNFDVFAQAGGAKTGLIKSFPVTVGNGQVTISFTSVTQNPEINGIEILPQ